jgi:hypothetical protein
VERQNKAMNYQRLANALGITLQELELLDFYNEEIFNSSGIAVQNEFVFSETSPRQILNKIVGLDQNNHIILDV